MTRTDGKTDLLLINPPWIIASDSNFWKNIGSCLPSLGIAYIASFLEKHGFAVKVLDCTAEKYAAEDVPGVLSGMEAPRFIGLTATTPLISSALAIAAACRKLFPEAVIVLGGVHPSVMPEEVLASPDVDLVVRGEGEETMLELVRGAPPETTAGVSYRKDGRVVHNQDRALIHDLDIIPPPAYHLLPMDKYYPATGSYRRLPAASIFATRGCPGRCTFCYRTFMGRVRKRSARNILEEIKLLTGNYGVREIAFYDDAFTVYKDVVLEFCRLLKENRIDITWSCFSRVDTIDEEMLRAMKAAGCHLILFGIESGDERILRSIGKRINLDKALEITRCARKAGVNTRASFMLGNPGETEESVRKTIDFAFRLDPDQLHFNITTAYPGTEVYEWAKANGALKDIPYSQLHTSEANLELPTISSAVLKKYYREVHRRFYFSPRVMLRRLLNIRTFCQLQGEIKGFLALLRIFR